MADALTLAVIALLVFLVSFAYANVGLGGGGLYVPILLLLYVDDDDIVVPISLALATATAISSTYNHWRKGYVDLRIGKHLVAGAMLGAILGTAFTLDVLLSVRDFKVFFSALLFVLGVLLLNDWRRGNTLEDDVPGRLSWRRMTTASVATAASGFISGSAGVGGGVFNVPILTYLLGQRTRTAIGTSSLIIIPTAIFGFAIFLVREGAPGPFAAIPILFPLTLLGGFLGSRWGLKALRTRSVAFLFIGVVFLADALVVLDVLNVI